jgi:MFS family permease
MPDAATETAAPPAAPPTPVGGLRSRTFVGLLVAQFFAAFNDQAIHAAAMFFAINKQLLTEKTAISLMPILFYSPWAIFCTVAGHLADKYPKRNTLVAWKVAEVVITAVALAGFYLGNHGMPTAGPWLVLGCVFLMGVHSAFFVPAKYGVMPEILPPHLLSRGNGLLESLSFLAVILGTVCGGVLSYLFLGREQYIGWVLFALAVVGAAASLLIRPMPAADPHRRLPLNVYGPIVRSVRTLLGTRPLRVAILGIAFFTFVVAFMRAAVYMLGESQNPRWDELKTSVIVGTVALGIGIGSPLAGWLSGRRVELRLVVLGAAGMITLLCVAAWQLTNTPVLVACIVGVGVFTGFYIVPLFTLLQHRAPKTSKGEMIATSNFVNVVGAITSSLLFFGVVTLAQRTGLSPEVVNAPPPDRRAALPGERVVLGAGELKAVEYRHGRAAYFVVAGADGTDLTPQVDLEPEHPRTFREIVDDVIGRERKDAVIEVSKAVGPGERVWVTRFDLDGVPHYELSPFGEKLNVSADYDNKRLPGFLFLGAAGLTLLILLALGRPLLQVQKQERETEGH